MKTSLAGLVVLFALLLLPVMACAEGVFTIEPPDGSVLVEAESFSPGGWYVLDEPLASGTQWLRCNLADKVAEKTVELPTGHYRLWVRCTDNGHYPGHYSYRVRVNGAEYWAGTVEPLAYNWCWQSLGEVEGGSVTIRIDLADSWNTGCDCFLFVPDLDYRPTGAPMLRLLEATAPDGREGGPAQITFEAPSKAEGECWIALRREGQVIWSKQASPESEPSNTPGRSLLKVAVEIPPQRYSPEGRHTLSVELGDLQWEGRETGDATVAELDFGSVPIPRPCVAKVLPWQGTPTLFINGKPVFPFAFLGVHTGHYGEFAAQGAHLYSVGCGIGNGQVGQFDAGEPTRLFEEVLRRDPEALILPRIQLEPPAAWLAAHPDQRVVFDNGTVGPQSFASEEWLELICGDLERFITWLRGSPFADRVIGLHLCTGYSAEWQSWGLWDGLRGDFSPAFTAFFQSWLREKYASDEALALAWGQPGLTFEGALVPTRTRREAPAGLLWRPDADRQVTDFYEAYALAAARAITRIAGAVKEASKGEVLAGFFYGYAPQYGGLAPETQHLALAKVLECPEVDFLSAPAMYSGRQPGGTSTFMSLTDSIKLHGKLWLNESDIRTHLQQDPTGRSADMQQTLGVLKREYAAVRTRGAGQWWFDMQDGWFSDPTILSLFGEMNRLGQEAVAGPTPLELKPEIAVLLSERSAMRMADGGKGDIWFKALTAQVAALDRIGAPAGLYLLEDIDRMPDARLIILLNAFDLTSEEREKLERLKSEGRVVVFIYAAGLGTVEESGDVEESLISLREFTGQQLIRLRSGPFQVRLTDDPLCEGLRYGEPGFGMATDTYGSEVSALPRFGVEGSERVLGVFEKGEVALSLAEKSGWVSVYSAAPGLPPGLLRNLARLAGAHIYSDTDDALYAGRGLVALHAWQAGLKVIHLPEKLLARELFVPEAPEQLTDTLQFEMEAFETRIFEVRRP